MRSALDREAPVSKFSFTEFAITTATNAQISQNLTKATLPTRPTTTTTSKPTAATPSAAAASSLASPALQQQASDGSLAVNGVSIRPGLDRNPSSSSMFLGGDREGLSPMVKVGTHGGGVIVLLKVNVVNQADVRVSTTVSV
jgi:hypothetical protein